MTSVRALTSCLAGEEEGNPSPCGNPQLDSWPMFLKSSRRILLSLSFLLPFNAHLFLCPESQLSSWLPVLDVVFLALELYCVCSMQMGGLQQACHQIKTCSCELSHSRSEHS